MCYDSQADRYYINDMANYTVVPRSADDGFDVAVIGGDGARQTVLNFRTQADAEAWIMQDEEHERRQNSTMGK